MTPMTRDFSKEHRHPGGQRETSLSVPVSCISQLQTGTAFIKVRGEDPPCALSLPQQEGYYVLQRGRIKVGQLGPPFIPTLLKFTLTYKDH